MKPSRVWYNVKAQVADPSVTDIYITDFIGDWMDDYFGVGVSAKQFIEDLSALPDSVRTVRVHINSPGGDVFGAVNIANALRDQRVSKGRTVETIVDGLAASAASVILMAGAPIRIADNGMVMVHNPWSVAMGNAAEMRATADTLEAITASIVATYQWHSQLDAKEIGKLMDAATWMGADEAVANGFADEVVAGLKAAASIDPRAVKFLSAPEQFADRIGELVRPVPEAEPVPAPVAAVPEPVLAAVPLASAEEVLKLCKEAGLSLDAASRIFDEGNTPDVARTRIAEARERQAVETARVTDINAICKKFDLEDLAAGIVASGMTVEQVKSHVAVVRGRLDRAVTINGALGPDGGAKPKPVINVKEVYERENARCK